MESTAELKGRFESAFKRYSVQATRLRGMRASLPGPTGSVHIHALHELWRAQRKAEREYRSVRLEYAKRRLALGRAISIDTLGLAVDDTFHVCFRWSFDNPLAMVGGFARRREDARKVSPVASRRQTVTKGRTQYGKQVRR